MLVCVFSSVVDQGRPTSEGPLQSVRTNAILVKVQVRRAPRYLRKSTVCNVRASDGIIRAFWQTLDDVKARHKKELKALDGSGRKLLKQANKNKAKTAEAESKIAQVGREEK